MTGKAEGRFHSSRKLVKDLITSPPLSVRLGKQVLPGGGLRTVAAPDKEKQFRRKLSGRLAKRLENTLLNLEECLEFRGLNPIDICPTWFHPTSL